MPDVVTFHFPTAQMSNGGTNSQVCCICRLVCLFCVVPCGRESVAGFRFFWAKFVAKALGMVGDFSRHVAGVPTK